MDGKGRLGRRGEELAGQYLEARGHQVLERNWRSGHLEIDLITLAPDGLHFVEVKSRTAPAAVPPQEQVDRTKRRRIVSASRAYLRSPRRGIFRDRECFFDVVAVLFDGNKSEISWFPQAFLPIDL